MRHEFEDLGRRVMLLNGRQLDHVQLILLGIRDVTTEYQAGLALRESEAQYRTLVQNLHDYAILMLDPFGIIRHWSGGATRMTGYSPEEAIGKHVSLIYPREQVESGSVNAELEEARNTGAHEREGWQLRRTASASGGTKSSRRFERTTDAS